MPVSNQEKEVSMYVQVLDKFGKAIARKFFTTLYAAECWLDAQFPHRDMLGYQIEVFYPESGSLI